MTREESVNAYKEYVDNHIANVKKAFDKYGEKLCNALNVDIERLKAMIEIHDKSKYSEEEFEGYRVFFYKSDEDNKEYLNDKNIKLSFDEAWRHHLIYNSHHPEFWINTYPINGNIIINDMDKLSIAEMLLDWAAMSKGDEIPAYDYWYNGDGQNKPFSENTREIIESCIWIFKDE